VHNLIIKLKTTGSPPDKDQTGKEKCWQKRNWTVLVLDLKYHQDLLNDKLRGWVFRTSPHEGPQNC